MLALLRLGLVRKKALLFVNSIDAGFRLRLFLEAFGVRAAVLNAELPLNSRHHILQVGRGAFSPCSVGRRLMRLLRAASADQQQHHACCACIMHCSTACRVCSMMSYGGRVPACLC